MRLVAWNCQGGLHSKLSHLLALEPDIAVVSECATTSILREKAPFFIPQSSTWIGDLRDRGMAVFGFGDYSVELDECYDKSLKLVAPIRVIGPISFHLLAVCADNDRLRKDDKGPLLLAFDRYESFCRSASLIVAGDFNNNRLWDKPDYAHNHSNSVDRLSDLGLESVYHRHTGEAGGCEKKATYFHGRKPDKPYHIDYCFLPTTWNVSEFYLGEYDSWHKVSDHMPIAVTCAGK